MKDVMKDDSDVLEKFRQCCLRYAELVAAAQVNIIPFKDETLPIYASLAKDAKQRALAHILADIEIFESMLAEKQSLKDSSKHVWRFLRQMNLTPQSDIFDKMSDNDVVEIYIPDETGQRQAFRNLRFLECVSVTLEQLFSLDWRVLCNREEKYSQQILDSGMSILEGRVTTTIAIDHIEPHRVWEVDSEALMNWIIRMKYFSPVRSQGKIVGVLSINDTTILGSLKNRA